MRSITDSLSDAVTGTIGRRPSGARLYHRGSRFGDPERRKIDRNLVARILFAYSGERDQPFRLKVITDSGDRDHAGILCVRT